MNIVNIYGNRESDHAWDGRRDACHPLSLLPTLSPSHEKDNHQQVNETDSQCKLGNHILGGLIFQKEQQDASDKGDVKSEVKCCSAKKGIHFSVE